MTTPDTASNPTAGNQATGTTTGQSFLGTMQEPAKAEPAKAEPAASTTTETKPESPALAGWTSAVTKELRSDPRFVEYASKFGRFDDLVKSAMDLEAKAGSMVAIPGEDAKPEEVEAYLEKLGVPKTHSEYQIEPDTALGQTPEAVEGFKALAHKLKLSQAQAKELYEATSAIAKGTLEQYQADQARKITEGAAAVEATLKKEWGPQHTQNVETMRRGMSAYATPALMKEIASSGLGNSPEMAKLFFKLGAMVREDSATTGASGGTPPPQSMGQLMYPKG